MTHPTLQFPQKQPQNGRYGRIPMDLLPKFRELSHLEVHVFTVLSVLANFKRDPVGEVSLTNSELAREVGIDRKSLWRALKALVDHELVALGHNGRVMVPHYLCHQATPPVAPRHAESPQPQPSIGSCEPPIRSEEVSEEEVKKKRGKRSAKASPPHHLDGLVRWDKMHRRLSFSQNGTKKLQVLLTQLAVDEGLQRLLDQGELQEGLGRLNGHLMGNPFKTNPKTLPAIVLNWFETDLRRKNNHPQRGKPLAQRIEEKTRERMNDGIEESGQSDNGFTQQLLESGDFRRHS